MLDVLHIDEDEKWNKVVKSFNTYDVYYLSGYTKAFQTHGDGIPVLFLYEDKNIRAINVVMKRDIENNQKFSRIIPPNTFYDITTPYGYGGFIIEGSFTDDSLINLEKEYSSYCRDNGIISEFVRFHPVIDNSKDIYSIYEITDLGKTITLKLESQEQIWSDLTSKNRNVIRKATKSNVKVYWGRNDELFKEFIHLYNETMDRDSANDYYYFKKDFYDSILTDMKYNSLMVYATLGRKIISMSMILFSNQQMHYHLSASKREYQHLAPTNLLLYEAACWGHENGYKTFHLGGGLGSKEDSLFKFKKAFNKNSNTQFSIGRKIFNQEKYDELVNIRCMEKGFDKNTSFFPSYRDV